MIRKIVILGGGSAGWLTAGLLAAECQQIEIILIESPEVGAIGVGEGTWPTMRSTLRKIGISETAFVRECAASFKQGSKFIGWKNGSASDIYHHPFTLPSGGSDSNIVEAWRSARPNTPFSEAVSMQSVISDRGLAPKQITTAEYAGVLNYGYHLDADRLVHLLREHCQKKLGVKLIHDHVIKVHAIENGDISSLQTKSHGMVAGDLFIDCSGGQSLLIGQHFGIQFLSQSKYSVNDRVLAARVPYTTDMPNIASMTLATAMSAGWVWDIGLRTRRGVGYVYSSSHINDSEAEAELMAYLSNNQRNVDTDSIEFRPLRIDAGFREKIWCNNCVAIGMASGFIEPLEASALAMVELSAKMIANELPMDRKNMDLVAIRFNKVFRYRWDRVVEFLKLHYVLSERNDSDYWRDARSPDGIPDSLRNLLELWRYRSPSRYDFDAIEEIFPYASYQYVLYGMGFHPPIPFKKSSDQIDAGVDAINANGLLLGKYIEQLPKNFDLLEKICAYGLHKI